ncbi:MAG TPA: EamA family transporter [Terriglobales bacterium]|nr:EamA family transporter [Terriglobales bacterium]
MPAAPTTRLDAVPPELLIIVGTLSVQCGAGLATNLLREYGPLPVVAMRIMFGAILLLVFRRVRLSGASRAALLSCVALGVILAAMNALFYVALSRIPLGVAVTIEFWGPLTIAVLGSRRWLDFVWVVLAAAGIYILAGGRMEADDVVGLVAVSGAGLCWAIYIHVGGRVARYWPDGGGLTLAMVVASVLVLPVTLVLSDVRPLLVAPLALAGGVVVALFSSAIPYTLELAALRRLPAATFGVLMSLEPAIAAAVGFLLLNQVLGLRDLVAIACVAIASAGASLSARRLAATPGELEAV